MSTAAGKVIEIGNLVLNRKKGTSFKMGDDIKITIAEIDGKYVKILIQAPKSMKISRDDMKNDSENHLENHLENSENNSLT